ncbi:MAG TPA: DUF6079 family protein [Candidatus Binataceae bacterium]|nr:DUF6079 family protein [Candidatus Binataceae bacterium]
MALEAVPRERTVQCYGATRGAQRTLSILTERRASGVGDFFWLSDPPGAGKTHFLNYFIALRNRLATAQTEGRELVLALDYPELGSVAQLENDVPSALAAALGGGERRGAALWRKIGAEAAAEVAMGEARRAGIRAVSVAIDFSLNEAPAFAADLVRIAQTSTRPTLTVIAAGRGDPPNGALPVEVGAADLAEQLVVAVGRARRLEPRWTLMRDLYQGIEIAPFAPEEILPFHPETLRALAALVQPGVAGLAPLAREVLAAHKTAASLVYPCDLLSIAEIEHMANERLGVGGRAALRRANAAAQSMPRPSRHLADQMVRTLVIAYLCGPAPALELDQLWSRLPAPAGAAPAGYAAPAAQERNRILHELAASTHGAITASSVGAAFVPARESSPDAEEFNQALPLLRLFDPGLSAIGGASDLTTALTNLDRVLSDLIEEAQRVADTLKGYGLAYGIQPDSHVTGAIEAFIELATIGARRLIEQGANEQRLLSAQAIAASYQDIAAAAAFVPALLAMKEYLDGARLESDSDHRANPEVEALATELRLLQAELGPRAAYSRARDSLQARFEKFKWAYIEQYRASHERWRAEMEKASVLLVDVERCLQALVRLDSIAALGPPLADQFSTQMHEARDVVRICKLNGQFNAYAAALCPQCSYVMGTSSPGPRLAELLDKVRRGLRDKLAILSRGAIARLIKKYDHAHRLDGFLKITQAAQTEALAAVLDDQLTAYLARLLQEREAQPIRRAER